MFILSMLIETYLIVVHCGTSVRSQNTLANQFKVLQHTGQPVSGLTAHWSTSLMAYNTLANLHCEKGDFFSGVVQLSQAMTEELEENDLFSKMP